MKRKLHNAKQSILPLCLSFFLPLLISTLLFALKGVAPFGNYSVARVDAWAQYYPFLSQFRHTLLNGGSLEYTQSVGMGVGYFPMIAYYLSSPMYLLSPLFSEAALPFFLLLVTVLKFSLAGLSMYLYLRIVYRRTDLIMVFFSMLYVFCAWSMGYYWNVIWLDVFALLPLLTAGTVCMLREGRYKLYVIALALCLWCNYYISFCCCIFVLLCFMGYHFCKKSKLSALLRSLSRFAICTVLAFSLSAALLLPALLGMRNASSAAGAELHLFAIRLPDYSEHFRPDFFFSALGQMLGRSLPLSTPTTLDGLPNLFTGFSVLILAGYYLRCKEVSRRERIFHAALLLFFMLSCIFSLLDYIWHGFHFPNMLPNRFTFLFSFVLLGMAYRGFTLLPSARPSTILPPLFFGVLTIILGYFFRSELSYGFYGLILSVLILAGIAVVFFLHTKKLPAFLRPALAKRIALVLLCLILFSEACLSAYFGIKAGITVEELTPHGDAISALLENNPDSEPLYRTEVLRTGDSNKGALYHFNSAGTYSSTALAAFCRLSGAFGTHAWAESNTNTYFESPPFTNTLLGLKYLIECEGRHTLPDYTTVLDEVEGIRLLQSNTYSGIGFMTEAALGQYAIPADSLDPFAEQSQILSLATGVEDALYSYVYDPVLSASEGCTLEATQNNSQFLYTVGDGVDKGQFYLTYTMDRSGLLCAAPRMRGSNTMRIYLNDVPLVQTSPGARGIIALGNVEIGDKIRFEFESGNYRSAGLSLRLAFHNSELFDRALPLLTDEVWQLEKNDITELKGSITAKKDGLFYTSIPYEPGWTATVDGQPVSLAQTYDAKAASVRLTDGVIAFPLEAGTHEIILSYAAPGKTLGLCLSILSLLCFIALCIWKKSYLLPDASTSATVSNQEDAPSSAAT